MGKGLTRVLKRSKSVGNEYDKLTSEKDEEFAYIYPFIKSTCDGEQKQARFVMDCKQSSVSSTNVDFVP